MPKGEVPERYRDILASTALGHLATIGADGRPQVNPVWFLSDGQHVSLSVKPETAKYRNLRANPSVAMSVSDLDRPDRYLEIRGRGRRVRAVRDPGLGQSTGAQVHRWRLHRGHRRRAPLQGGDPNRCLDGAGLTATTGRGHSERAYPGILRPRLLARARVHGQAGVRAGGTCARVNHFKPR